MSLFGNASPVRQRRWVFLAFLVLLHLVMLAEPGTRLGHGLFLSHIGIGLLWQPFVQPRRRLSFGGIAIVLALALTMTYFLDWGFLLIWTMLLCGVAGGKIFLFPDRYERLFHLFALGYLATMVLALMLPQVLENLNLAHASMTAPVLYLAPVAFLAMAALPVGEARQEGRAASVDFVYGVMVFLLLAVIVLGALSFSLLFKASYFEALLMTLALVAGLLLLLGFIWDPRAGFGGLGAAVAQHVMSLGLPIEDWLESLAELARREEDAERFMTLACRELPARLPGVLGGAWRVAEQAGSFGAQDGRRVRLGHGPLQLDLVTRAEPSPTLLWHYDLVVRLLAEIHQGKCRAQELQRLSYIEAIHETGARLTHDMKNLLQSLETLCRAAEHESQPPSPRFGELLRRQLPGITTRLRQILGKLAAPADGALHAGAPQSAALWLAALQARTAADWVDYVAVGNLAACQLADPEAFSSIVENLLQNVADKRQAAPAIRAAVRVAGTAEGLEIEVGDTGMPVQPDVVPQLFKERVASESGLGVGLYQCARLTEALGYRLELSENRPGRVCFSLRPQVRQAAACGRSAGTP